MILDNRDISEVVGKVRFPFDKPYIIVGATLDGRITTKNGGIRSNALPPHKNGVVAYSR